MQQVQRGADGLRQAGPTSSPRWMSREVAGRAASALFEPLRVSRAPLGRSAPRSSDPTAADQRRRWTINGDFLTLRPTGIARFAREVTTELDALVEADHPMARNLTLDLIAPVEPEHPPGLRHIRTSHLPEFRPHLPQVWVQAQLPRHLSGGLLSFCNLAPIRADRHIVCIHDLQTRTTPESYGWAFRLAHRLILPPLARRADVVTTVSAYSKATFVGFGLCPSEKVVVVPNGCDHALRWRADRASASWRRERPFVLCMGRNEIHKNTALAWRLAPALDALGLDVVVVGDFDPARLDAWLGHRPANVRCLARVTDDELARGFSEALCFLFPSKTEGFGLPALEAMACGCPVLASLSPAVIEACGSAALYADPDDLAAWIQALTRLVDESDLGPSLSAAGRAQAGRFTWREVAKTYLRLMAAVDERRAHPRALGLPPVPRDHDSLRPQYR